MEKMLHKLAQQLDSLDEASLTALWSKYATITSRFEPTRRWEEACLILSMIQAKRWKNQLFNYSWQRQRLPPVTGEGGEAPSVPEFSFELAPLAAPEKSVPVKPCKILSFPGQGAPGRAESRKE